MTERSKIISAGAESFIETPVTNQTRLGARQISIHPGHDFTLRERATPETQLVQRAVPTTPASAPLRDAKKPAAIVIDLAGRGVRADQHTIDIDQADVVRLARDGDVLPDIRRQREGNTRATVLRSPEILVDVIHVLLDDPVDTGPVIVVQDVRVCGLRSRRIGPEGNGKGLIAKNISIIHMVTASRILDGSLRIAGKAARGRSHARIIYAILPAGHRKGQVGGTHTGIGHERAGGIENRNDITETARNRLAQSDFDNGATDMVAQCEIISSIPDADIAHHTGIQVAITLSQTNGGSIRNGVIHLVLKLERRTGKSYSNSILTLIIIVAGDAHQISAGLRKRHGAALAPSIVVWIKRSQRRAILAQYLVIHLAGGGIAHGVHGDHHLVTAVAGELPVINITGIGARAPSGSSAQTAGRRIFTQ